MEACVHLGEIFQAKQRAKQEVIFFTMSSMTEGKQAMWNPVEKKITWKQDARYGNKLT